MVDVENESIHILPTGEPEYDHIFLLGDATPAGWNIKSPIPLVKDEANPYLFTWEGPLKAGELKFSTYTGDWCDGEWINASQPGQALGASDYIITNGCDGPDNKSRV